ncbi:MAG TPA: 3-hydroxyacyl-CoA dehydrogenase NAD-binding domain-containing protein [Cyclobacteriaceae bacterium]|nr:3-hydroxyacyl-CoA dehydrogenase NAD-binding domain-containing protein [Cyclobacteriaceae bacterium]
MELSAIKRIGIAGAGTMGQGIAQVFAVHGYQVILFDIQASMLKTAAGLIEKNLQTAVDKKKITAAIKNQALENLTYTHQLNDLAADLIIEAIIEKAQAKIDLFQSLETINTNECVLASNTSSIPITQIAAPLKHPERVIGLHFFNPAHIMKLVEIIAGAATDVKYIELMQALCLKCEKVPVLAKDSPGFIVNRVARHYYVESLKILEENIANVEGIDALLEASGFKMGPFKLMDLIGVDTNFAVTSSMYNAFHQDAKFRPSRIQEQKVVAGQHGRKSGKGFYDYKKT